MSRTKGTALLSRVEFLKQKGRLDVLDRLSAADKLTVDQALPIGLYALDLKERLDETIARALTPDNMDATYKELGRWSAAVNFANYHNSFLRPGDPNATLANGPAMRRMYYDDGEATYERTSDHAGVFRVRGQKDARWADCQGTAGYWEQAIELSGGKNAHVEHTTCLSKGDALCTYVMTWR